MLRLDPVIDNGAPHVTVWVGDRLLLDAKLDKRITVRYFVELTSTFNISVTLSDKAYDENLETAIIIESLTLDGHELIPKFNHLTTYETSQAVGLTTNYLGYNGRWSLNIDRPFYQWWHHANNRGWLLIPQ
jgi:hypothetical protein